jgi:hypothetical protein
MNKEKSPAKLAVIQEWDEWSKTHADSTGGFLFFQFCSADAPIYCSTSKRAATVAGRSRVAVERGQSKKMIAR